MTTEEESRMTPIIQKSGLPPPTLRDRPPD